MRSFMRDLALATLAGVLVAVITAAGSKALSGGPPPRILLVGVVTVPIAYFVIRMWVEAGLGDSWWEKVLTIVILMMIPIAAAALLTWSALDWFWPGLR